MTCYYPPLEMPVSYTATCLGEWDESKLNTNCPLPSNTASASHAHHIRATHQCPNSMQSSTPLHPQLVVHLPALGINSYLLQRFANDTLQVLGGIWTYILRQVWMFTQCRKLA